MSAPFDRVQLAAFTVPPATSQAAPAVQDVSFPAGKVVQIEVVIPDGHAGVTGLAIMQSQSIVIPASGNVWIVSNDEKIIWDYRDVLNNGSWQLSGYNNDQTNPHTFYLRFLVAENPTPGGGVQPTVVLDTADIEAAGEDLVTTAAAGVSGDGA